jgi:hypothetical protein
MRLQDALMAGERPWAHKARRAAVWAAQVCRCLTRTRIEIGAIARMAPTVRVPTPSSIHPCLAQRPTARAPPRRPAPRRQRRPQAARGRASCLSSPRTPRMTRG